MVHLKCCVVCAKWLACRKAVRIGPPPPESRVRANCSMDSLWLELFGNDMDLQKHVHLSLSEITTMNIEWMWLLNQQIMSNCWFHVIVSLFFLYTIFLMLFEYLIFVFLTRKEVQGPCERATNLVDRVGCKGLLFMWKCHEKRRKGLRCVQGPQDMEAHLPIVVALALKWNWILNLMVLTTWFNVLENPEALASLFVALAHGPCTSSHGPCTGPCPKKTAPFWPSKR